MSKLEFVTKYFKAIEGGDLDALLNCYDESALQIELPNRLKPQGDRRSPSDLKRDFAAGQKILKSQTYEILSLVEGKNRAAVEVLWRGIVGMDIKSLKVGDVMTAHSAIFFEFEKDRIIKQKNYDCFEVF